MNNHQKFLSGLLVGAIGGAALAIFFSSDKGKQFIATAKIKLQNLHDELEKISVKDEVIIDEVEMKISET